MVQATSLLAVVDGSSSFRPRRTDLGQWTSLLADLYPPGEVAAADVQAEEALRPDVLLSVQRLDVIVSAIQRQGHGGSLLLVPRGPGAVERSIDYPLQIVGDSSELLRKHNARVDLALANSRDPADSKTKLQAILDVAAVDDRARARDAALDLVGGLSAIDGAVVLDCALRVKGFGAKIRSAAARPTDFRKVDFLTDEEATVQSLDEFGGTRHQSAASFVAATRGALAIVVSQDGSLSAFGLSRKSNELIWARNLHFLLVGINLLR